MSVLEILALVAMFFLGVVFLGGAVNMRRNTVSRSIVRARVWAWRALRGFS